MVITTRPKDRRPCSGRANWKWVPPVVLALSLGISASPTAGAGPVIFSSERGFHDSPFRLTLSSGAGGETIRYTLDGSAPTREHGRVYEKPLRLERTTVVRAIAYKGNDPVVEIPPGYVTSFVSTRHGPSRPHSFDYGMDPEVLGAAESGDLVSHLLELPSLCLALDVADFNTLYTEHRQRGVRWDPRMRDRPDKG